MKADNDYENVTVHDLIADDAFLDWINCPDEQLDKHWNGLVARRPELSVVLDEARALVQRMRFVEHQAPIGKQQAIFDRIKDEAGLTDTTTHRKKVVSFKRWLPVAASLSLFALVGIWFYTRNNGKPTGGLDESSQVASSLREGRIFMSDGKSLPISGLQGRSAMEDGSIHLQLLGDGLVYENHATGAKVEVDSVISPIGQVFQVGLPDGSTVWMNSGSTIRLAGRYTASQRNVAVTGRCYFAITPKAGLPFSVTMDHREVTVLGTQFDVVNYPDMLNSVTLIEGSVRLSGAEMLPVVLKPGQQARMADDGKPIIDDVDVTRVSSWKDGSFVFQNETIVEVMQQLGVWYGVRIVFEGTEPELPISGSIPTSLSLEQALSILQNTGVDATFNISGHTVSVAKRDIQ